MKQDQQSGIMRISFKSLSILLVVLLLGICTDKNNTADAQDSPVRLLNQNSSSKYLAISGAEKSDGGNVILWDDVQQRDIWWSFEQIGEDTYKIRNVNSGKYLAVSGSATTDGGNVIQWKDVGQQDILWDLESVDESSCYKIRNANSGKYLAVSGGATTDGANVLQWKDQNQQDIIWCLRP